MPVLTLEPSNATALSIRAKALVFEDPRSKELLQRIQQIAPSNATVLVTGETGTGKEILARHVHDLSARRDKVFVGVNCGAFSDTLVESELFGHERGAFTGAIGAKAGWFESAHGGTLFLDEIGDLPLGVQVKLLRVLQEREVVRLGSRHVVPIDVRLIAATNVNLDEAVAAGHFREDLFYRLNVATLSVPALRERPGDILPLAGYFLELYRQRLGRPPAVMTGDAMDRLIAHEWPGNIRELENVLHHALLICHGDQAGASDLRLSTLPGKAKPTSSPPAKTAPLEDALAVLFEQDVPSLFEHVEKILIRTAYRHCDDNQVQTAKLLGISRNVVRARLMQYGEIASSARSPSVPPQPLDAPSSIAHVSPQSTDRDVVRIGYQKVGLLTLLKARGTFDQAVSKWNIGIEWSEFPGGTQIADALRLGGLDVGIVGEGPTIFAQGGSEPVVYLAAEPTSPEREAIVVPQRSPIRRVSDLRGRTVAVNKGANVHYLLIRALEEAGVPYHEVNVVYVPPASGWAAFESGAVDAWAIWDPLLGSVEHEKGARVLRDATGLATNTLYYMGSRRFADTRAELLDVFLDELKRSADWANTHPEHALDMLVRELQLSRLSIGRATGKTPALVPIDSSLVASQQQVADAFLRLRLIPRAVRVAEAQWRAPPRTEASSDAVRPRHFASGV